MKNTRAELLIATAKAKVTIPYGNKNIVDGVKIFHCYEDPPPKMSYWDDCSLRVGSQILSVWWTHPRYEYQNKCREFAHVKMHARNGMMPRDDGWINSGEKISRKVGKSRKKVSCYRMSALSQESIDWFDELKKIELEVLGDVNNGVRVVPWYQVEQLRYGRMMDLCMPLEVRCDSEVIELAKLAKEIYVKKLRLADICPQYEYTAEDWCDEHPPETVPFHSHMVSP